jgi:hypothetical protein
MDQITLFWGSGQIFRFHMRYFQKSHVLGFHKTSQNLSSFRELLFSIFQGTRAIKPALDYYQLSLSNTNRVFWT